MFIDLFDFGEYFYYVNYKEYIEIVLVYLGEEEEYVIVSL